MSTDPLEASVLARARDGLRPTEQRRTQLLQRMATNMGQVPSEPLAPCPDPPSQVFAVESLRNLLNGSGRLLFTSRAVVWALVFGAAAGVGGAHLAGVFRGEAVQPAQRNVYSARGAVRSSNGSEVVAARMGDESSSASQATAPSPVELAVIPQELDDGATKRALPQPGTRDSTSPLSAGDEVSFYEELSYLRRAQAALRDGQSAMALGLMETLDSMPSKGALWAERNMTKVLALCQLGRGEEAKTIATRVTQADEGQVYRKRLEASCAATMHGGAQEK